MSTRRMLAPLAVAAMLAASAAPAAAGDPPDWWARHVGFMTRDGGRWTTPNPAAANDPSAPEFFGMSWRVVNDGFGLVGRLYGLRDGKEGAEFWTFREFYHPGEGRIVFQQWGGPGVYGAGETREAAPDAYSLDQTFWLGDGRNWREGHRALEQGDVYETRVFDIDAEGRWTPSGQSLWRRAPPEPASVKAP